MWLALRLTVFSASQSHAAKRLQLFWLHSFGGRRTNAPPVNRQVRDITLEFKSRYQAKVLGRWVSSGQKGCPAGRSNLGRGGRFWQSSADRSGSRIIT